MATNSVGSSIILSVVLPFTIKCAEKMSMKWDNSSMVGKAGVNGKCKDYPCTHTHKQRHILVCKYILHKHVCIMYGYIQFKTMSSKIEILQNPELKGQALGNLH